MSTARMTRLAGAAAILLGTSSAFGGDDARLVCWKPWKYGYIPAPAVAYSVPVYTSPMYYAPAPEVAPPPAPAGYYQPGPEVPQGVADVPGPRPTIVVGYRGRFFSGAVAIPFGGRSRTSSAAPPGLPERAPTPRPNESFRYDGGPTNPVPLPVPDVVPPTDPVPATVPALHRVMWERRLPKAKYPAYGERPTRSGTADPLLVKHPAPG